MDNHRLIPLTYDTLLRERLKLTTLLITVIVIIVVVVIIIIIIIIIMSFSELMEQEPRHHLVLNCLHSTFAVEQLPIQFFQSVSRRNVTKRRVQSLFLSVTFFDK